MVSNSNNFSNKCLLENILLFYCINKLKNIDILNNNDKCLKQNKCNM